MSGMRVFFLSSRFKLKSSFETCKIYLLRKSIDLYYPLNLVSYTSEGCKIYLLHESINFYSSLNLVKRKVELISVKHLDRNSSLNLECRLHRECHYIVMTIGVNIQIYLLYKSINFYSPLIKRKNFYSSEISTLP